MKNDFKMMNTKREIDLKKSENKFEPGNKTVIT